MKVNYLDIFGVTKVNKWQVNFAGIKILVTKSLNKFSQLFLVCYQNDAFENDALSIGSDNLYYMICQFYMMHVKVKHYVKEFIWCPWDY